MHDVECGDGGIAARRGPLRLRGFLRLALRHAVSIAPTDHNLCRIHRLRNRNLTTTEKADALYEELEASCDRFERLYIDHIRWDEWDEIKEAAIDMRKAAVSSAKLKLAQAADLAPEPTAGE